MDIDQRRARREARKRELARRRTWGLAAAAVVLAVAAVALAVVLDGSSSKVGGAGSGRLASRSSHGRSRDGGTAGAGVSAGAGYRSAIVTPAQAAHRTPSGASVPILMYHVIHPPPAGAKFPGLYVDPEEFSEQMHALASAGYHAITMDQMLANWTRGTPLPAGKPIVISFDNGYQSQYTNALPVLRALGWVGVENIQLSGLPPSQGGLSEAQVRGLLAAGWELDTQGISHAELTTLSPAALHEQVAGARATLQRRYDVPVNWFCYPSGHYNAAVVAEVKAAGYVGSTTVVPGWASPGGDSYRLPRLRVLGGTDAGELLAQIAAIRSDPPPPASYEAGE